MASTNTRSSDRVTLTFRLEALGTDQSGQPFAEPARTQLVSRGGAELVLKRRLAVGQSLRLRLPSAAGRLAGRNSASAPAEGREAEARVVAQLGGHPEGFAYGVALADPSAPLWDVTIPPLAASHLAMARLLMECVHCRSREVAYLDERELREFDLHQIVARSCRSCGVSTLWQPAAQEGMPKPSELERASRKSAPESFSLPRTNSRVRAILQACIHRPGEPDEIVVCENVSPTGLCFRSRRGYPPGTSLSVAVPFSPEGANIFIPAEIIYQQALPAIGLSRHGVAYSPSPAANGPSA
ncbi:MAG: PilZ domain-containing protein [Candidatus Acidiferrales bacterium]